MRLKIFGTIAIALMLAAPTAWAEPSVAQVTQAIQAGRLDQAQSMMREVLVAHPQSAEAQYVEARILARQGHWTDAAAALQKSEQLAPTMPFVKPQVLASFKQSLQRHVNKPTDKSNKAGHWGAVLAFFLGLVALIALISMFSRRRRQQAGMMYRGQPSGPFGGMNRYGPNMPMNPGGPMGGLPQQGGGLGSSLASGIATGIGVGAGLAAGQALAGSLFGRDNESGGVGGDGGNNDLGLSDDSWGNDQLASNEDYGLDDGGDSWG